MKNIKREFVVYFVCLGLSFIISWLGLREQPVAFFCLQILDLLLITFGESYKRKGNVFVTLGAILVVMLVAGVGMIPSVLIAWIFHINFFVVFEVVAFISIFLSNNKKRTPIKFG